MRFLLTRSRPIKLLLVAALALMLLGGGAAYAASQTSGTIKVCVAHKGGTLYKHAKCNRGDASLTWNVTGPRGPAGPPGPPAASMWALVSQNPSAKVIYGKGVTAVSGSDNGLVLVAFSHNVSKCAFVANITSTGGGYYPEHPTAMISEEFYSGGWGANGTTVGVYTLDNSQSAPVGGYDFSIAAYC